MTVPTLNVAGWWDQEDFYGPVTIYGELEKHDTANRNFLVVGPVAPRRLERGPGAEARQDRLRLADRRILPAEHRGAVLRLLPQGREAARAARGDGVRVGQQPWRTFGTWPPQEATTRSLYFHAGRQARVHPAGGRGIRRHPTATSAIRRIPFPTAPGRSSRPTTPRARAGTPGCWRTSGSCSTAPTC